MAQAGEVIVPHAAAPRAAYQIRSTVLQSSLSTLRERNHFERWSTLVDPKHRATIVESLAPTWLPIEVAFAHYQACEALDLPHAEQQAMGEAVGERIQGSFMVTLMKSARAAGFNPFVLLVQFNRLYARLFEGGSVQLTRTGPKDLDIELRELSLVRFAYFRTAFMGVVRAGLVCSGVKAGYVKQVSYRDAAQTFVMHASWV